MRSPLDLFGEYEIRLSETEEANRDKLVWKTVYLYKIKHNYDKKIYEVTMTTHQVPEDREYLEFARSSQKYWINRLPVYVSSSAEWATNRPITLDEIKHYFRNGLKEVLDEECRKINAHLSHDIVLKS